MALSAAQPEGAARIAQNCKAQGYLLVHGTSKWNRRYLILSEVREHTDHLAVDRTLPSPLPWYGPLTVAT